MSKLRYVDMSLGQPVSDSVALYAVRPSQVILSLGCTVTDLCCILCCQAFQIRKGYWDKWSK